MKKGLFLGALIAFAAVAVQGIATADEYYCNILKNDAITTFIYNPVAGSSCERIKRTGSMEAYEACVSKNALEKKLYEENISSCPQLHREHLKLNESHCSARYVTSPQPKVLDSKSSGADGEACLDNLMNKIKEVYPNIEY